MKKINGRGLANMNKSALNKSAFRKRLYRARERARKELERQGYYVLTANDRSWYATLVAISQRSGRAKIVRVIRPEVRMEELQFTTPENIQVENWLVKPGGFLIV